MVLIHIPGSSQLRLLARNNERRMDPRGIRRSPRTRGVPEEVPILVAEFPFQV